MSDDNSKKIGGFGVDDTGLKFQGYRVEHSYSPETPKLIQWVIKYSGGLVKDEKQAIYVLVGFAVLAIIVSLIVILGGGPKMPPPPPTPSEEGKL